MNVLVVNDDGWGAKGLMTLLPHVLPLGNVTVLVPDGPRSGMSNAVTATRPISLRKMEQFVSEELVSQCPNLQTYKLTNLQIYTTDGTPSDCVKLAINVLFKGDASQIDLVISGINHGSNAAINQIYSGTMGACFVAAEHNIPAIGLSIDDMSAEPDFSFMEPYIDQLLNRASCIVNRQPTSCIVHRQPSTLLNINAPKGKINGIKWTRQSRSHWTDEMAPVSLENGETGYKLAGYMVNDEPEATDTDQWALEHGYLSIQPCKIDMTNYAAL